jgi:uncharacterized protein YqfB (UPF0267 family)
MKNTMKKLLSLVLVAMLLVSAVPFQAAATQADASKQITFKVKVNDEDTVAYEVTQAPANGKSATVGAMLDHWYKGSYKGIKSIWISGQGTVADPSADTVVEVGQSVTVRVTKDEETTPTEKPTEAPVENKLIRFQIKFDKSDDVTYTKIATPENGESAVIANLLTYWFGADWSKTYKFEHAYSSNKKETYTDTNTTVYVDDTITIRLSTIKEAEETVKPITVKIVDDKGNAIAKQFEVTPANGKSSVVGDILTQRWMSNWKDSYEFVTAKSDEKGNNLSLSTTINAGDSLTVTLKAKSGSTPEGDTVRVTFYGTDGKAVSTYNVTSGSSIDSKKVSDAQSKADNKTGYTFKGWKIDNKGDLYTSAQVAKLVIKGNVDFYAYLEKDTTNTNNKFPYKVYLHIFKDNKVDDPAKTINITEGIALDGKVTLDEVKTVVKNYYTAKTSDGIKYDGMYLAKGNWVGNFVNDTQKYTTIEDTNEMREESEVHINVMITNANAKSTTNEKPDKTNPKTGDMIFIPVIFMVVSGAAIAGVYFYNKKRNAR